MCSYCLTNPCLPGCPNYNPPIARNICNFCGGGIFIGEEYVENHIGEYRHVDCYKTTKELVNWLGYKVKTMEDESEKFY